MTSLLTQAARLLEPLVDEDGEPRTSSIREAARLMGLTEARAARVIESLHEVGFVNLEQDRVVPTVAGLALGLEVSTALRQIHVNELSMRRPFWTYIPEEVNLEG
jgi:DNA-binding IclR family transcriptional regulator